MPVPALVLSLDSGSGGTPSVPTQARGGRWMSLLKRVEQAQRRANALGEGNEDIVLPPLVPVMAPSAATLFAREELLRQIRLRLQTEVMIAFDSLLDIQDPAVLQ